MTAIENTQPLRAKEADVIIYSGNSSLRGRYDYMTDRYLLSEMLTNDFFGLCYALLRKHDIITITDAENNIMDVCVDEVDKRALKCWISKIERRYALPVVELRADVENDPGLAYRWRPSRAGGHSIITAAGEVFAINFDTKADAERAIANCYESRIFVPPHSHEPTDRFVSKNSKIYTPGG